ncbi:putative aldouronate transport system substrate-binding protein [Paenibacillus sp. yr247]|uniref:extracellular solute-binding protein n=1 Tax=Paenibacillus sp. yr247 TaxID=1761880 RepID=UPI000880E8B5|nr:extracellular solute-binding protein [Paenibacillus sp. yr247]SDM80961.1 putative aldouronate transport system substrate-binding protein [Paenibacillus sp. yr247]
MINKKVRFAGALFAAVILAGSVVGCASSKDAISKDSSSKAAATSNTPIDLSVMFYTSANIQITHDNNEAIKFLEQKFNVHLNIMDVPIKDYETKQNTVIASGSLPDVMVWSSYPNANLGSYIKQGAFMPLEKYIDATPNLKQFPQQIWNNLKAPDGHIYVIPRPRPIVRTGVVIRKDWLDKLGLPIPKTIDDFAKVAVAFAKNDPDGDGKENTYGIATDIKLQNVLPLFYAFGTGNEWLKQPDGTLKNFAIADGNKEALQWMRDLFAKGGLSKDFPVQQGIVRKELQSGKAGMMIESYIIDYAQDIAALKKVDPKAQLIYIDPPVGTTGSSGFNAGTGFAGGWLIPAKEKPEKVQKIMEILNWEASPEGYHFNKAGIDGIHNTKNADGTFTTNEKYISDDIKELIMISPYDIYSYVDGGAPADVQKVQRDALDMIKDKGLFNPAPTFLAPTSIEKKPDLDNLRLDYFIKIITGQLPMSAYDEFVAKWKAGGGDQITKETNDWFKTQGNK